MKSVRLCLLLILAAHATLMGCTRPVEKSAVSLKLNVPLDSVSTSSAERAIGIIVRVTGAGMSPVDFTWESPCNSGGGSSGCAIPAPASVAFDVPQGNDRFIQVFRLMQGSSGLLFQYDDATVNMTTAEVSVTLSLTNLNQAGALQSYIGVRVLNTSTSGPSGPVRTMIYPPGGKPGFPLWPTYIFNGWITAPTFTGVDMRFELSDGTVVLSGQPENLTQFPNNSPALLKVSVPARLRLYSGGGGSEEAAAERAIIGFVGPGVTASHYACFPASTGTSAYTGLFPAAVTTPIPYPTPGWNGLVWNSTSAPSASAVTRDATTSGTLVSSQPVACSAPNLEFATTMKFDYPRIGDDGAGAVVPFTGPFRHWPNNRPILVKFEGGKILVKWRYLPGVSVGTSGLSGVATFVTTADSPYAESYMAPGEMLKCESLPAYGWSEISDATPNDEQTELPVSYNKFLSSQIKAVVCPFAMVNGQRKFLAAAGSDRSITRGSGDLPRSLDLALFGNPAASQPVVGLGTRDWNFPIDRFLTGVQANYVPMLDGNTVSASDCASSNISLYARKNYGAWVAVTPHTAISIDGQSNQCSWTSTDVNADVGSASASDIIQLKLVAEDGFRQQMGIGQGSYLTGDLTASACAGNSANLTFVDASTGAVRTWSDLLVDIVGPGPATANATDIEKFYRLRYTDAGCATADLLPRKFDQNPGETICLEDAYEIHSEDPSLVVLSPKDLTGADCTIGAAPAVDVAVVGDTGTMSSGSPGIGSGVVTHSTVPSAIASFLSQESSAAAATNISKSRFQVMAWMAEAGQAISRLNVVGGYLNSDGKPTDLLTASGVISTSATWTARATASVTAVMTVVGRWISSVLSTSLPQDVFATMTISDSAATGSLDLASLVQFKGSVKYISQLPFNGSRPAFAMVDSSTSPPTLRFVASIESYDDDSVQLVNLAHTTNIQSSQKPFIEVIGSTNNQSVAYVYAYGTEAYLCHRPSYGATATPTCLSLDKSSDTALWGHGTFGANVVVKAINWVRDASDIVIVIAAFDGTSADVIYRTSPIGMDSSGLSLNGTFALPGASTALSATPSGAYGFSVCSFTTEPRKLLWFSSGETNATLIRDVIVSSGTINVPGVAAGGASAPTCGGGCDASWKARCATVDNGTDKGYALVVTNNAGQTKPRVYRRGVMNNCGTVALAQLDLEDYLTGVNYNSAGAGQISLIDSAGSNDAEQPALYVAGKLTGTSPNQTMIYRHALGCSASTITVGVNSTGAQEVTGFPGDFVVNVMQPFYMDSWHSQGVGIDPTHMMGGDKGLLIWGLFR